MFLSLSSPILYDVRSIIYIYSLFLFLYKLSFISTRARERRTVAF
nr:MAG TPA: hypothetical protein [Caudoviricetes sp.]